MGETEPGFEAPAQPAQPAEQAELAQLAQAAQSEERPVSGRERPNVGYSVSFTVGKNSAREDDS